VSIRLQLNFRVGGKSKRKTLQIEMQSNKTVQKGKTTEWLWHWIMYAKDGRTLDPVAVAFLRGHVIALGRSHAFICIFTAGTDAAAFTLHLLTAFALTPRLQASSIHLHTSECRIFWPRTECKLLRLGSCQLNSLRTMYVYRHRFTLKTAINLVKRNAGQ